VYKIGELFFLVNRLKNQCTAALRTYFLSDLEGKRVGQDVHFIGISSLLSNLAAMPGVILATFRTASASTKVDFF
jgi:hypothetical protein